MFDNHNDNSKYWRGLVTGAMIGAGTALLLAQRKRREKLGSNAPGSDAPDDNAKGKDALDETLDMAREAAREVKSEAKDAWNKTLEEVKTSATGVEDLSKSATNDN